MVIGSWCVTGEHVSWRGGSVRCCSGTPGRMSDTLAASWSSSCSCASRGDAATDGARAWNGHRSWDTGNEVHRRRACLCRSVWCAPAVAAWVQTARRIWHTGASAGASVSCEGAKRYWSCRARRTLRTRNDRQLAVPTPEDRYSRLHSMQ